MVPRTKCRAGAASSSLLSDVVKTPDRIFEFVAKDVAGQDTERLLASATAAAVRVSHTVKLLIQAAPLQSTHWNVGQLLFWSNSSLSPRQPLVTLSHCSTVTALAPCYCSLILTPAHSALMTATTDAIGCTLQCGVSWRLHDDRPLAVHGESLSGCTPYKRCDHQKAPTRGGGALGLSQCMTNPCVGALLATRLATTTLVACP